jgi:hypothetical protein
MEPTVKRSKVRWIGWLLYAWAAYCMVRIGIVAYGIAVGGWHWQIYDIAGMIFGMVFALSLVYSGYLIRR